MTSRDRLLAGLLIIAAFGLLFIGLKFGSPEFRECMSKFRPQQYCNSQELIRNLSK